MSQKAILQKHWYDNDFAVKVPINITYLESVSGLTWTNRLLLGGFSGATLVTIFNKTMKKSYFKPRWILYAPSPSGISQNPVKIIVSNLPLWQTLCANDPHVLKYGGEIWKLK